MGHAAMEPTGERSDDEADTLIINHGTKPQWSRPMNGRMIQGYWPQTLNSWALQWSRPLGGRKTSPRAVTSTLATVPQ